MAETMSTEPIRNRPAVSGRLDRELRMVSTAKKECKSYAKGQYLYNIENKRLNLCYGGVSARIGKRSGKLLP